MVVSLLFMACSDSKAIYAEIEKEELIKTSNLSNVITPSGMIRFGDKYYVASGGALHERLVDGEDWSRADLTSVFDGISQIVSVDDSTAYAILVRDFHKEISQTALVKLTADGSSIDFDVIKTLSFGTEQLAKIFVVRGKDNVYATVLKAPYTGVSRYDYYENYQSDTRTILATDRNDIMTAVVSFKGTVYVSTQSQILTLAAGKLTEVEIIDKDSKEKITGYIGSIYSNGKLLYIANHEYLWSSSDVINWDRSFYRQRMFTQFLEIESSNFNGLLVGTKYLPSGISVIDSARDEGYYELDKGDISSLRKPSGNKYTSGVLDESGVIGFFLDKKTDNFFVFTSSQGLWRGSYESSASIDWFQE